MVNLLIRFLHRLNSIKMDDLPRRTTLKVDYGENSAKKVGRE